MPPAQVHQVRDSGCLPGLQLAADPPPLALARWEPVRFAWASAESARSERGFGSEAGPRGAWEARRPLILATRVTARGRRGEEAASGDVGPSDGLMAVLLALQPRAQVLEIRR